MPTTLTNARIVLPEGIRSDLSVIIEGGLIAGLREEAPAESEVVDLCGQLLLPGFIDVQVNGGGGRLFNTDPSVETIAIMAAAHRRFGTTGLLPTLISDDISVVERAVKAVHQSIEEGIPGVLGIHLEGPSLSRTRRGIHLAAKLQQLDQELIEVLCSLRNGRTLITLAPECVSREQVKQLVDRGVIVAAGHSDADYETVRGAIDAGVTGFTHLFNAMSQLTNRAPGMVGAALDDTATYAGIIVDGHHLHPATFRIAVKAKGTSRLMLVTDAMATVGADVLEFTLQGHSIRRDGDRLVSSDGVLAGSTLTMAAAVAHAVGQSGMSLSAAVQMASSTPANFLGLADQTGSIAVGMRADFVAMRDDYTVTQTWIDGVRECH